MDWDFDIANVNAASATFNDKAQVYQHQLELLQAKMDAYKAHNTSDRSSQMNTDWNTASNDIANIKQFLGEVSEHLNQGATGLTNVFSAA